MSERFMNPYTDYGFKKLFGTEENKELLISFLNAMIFDKEGVITSLTYKNIEQLGDNKDRRNCYFDVYCETQDGSSFIVEMQNARKSYFKDRSLFYAAKPIRDQAEKGEEWDFRLNDVYMVGVMNFRFPDKEYPEDSYYHVIQLMDVVDQHVFYDKLTLIYLEMPKLKNMAPRTDSFRDLWLYALQNLCYTDNYPEVLQKGIFKKLYEAAAMANMNDAQLLAYERSQKAMWDRYSERETARDEGREEGRMEGREEGKKELRTEIIVRMKSSGIDTATIAKITGLSEEEIQSIIVR
jgi:predicted transposase/invertase (TIGR01784 family)